MITIFNKVGRCFWCILPWKFFHEISWKTCSKWFNWNLFCISNVITNGKTQNRLFKYFLLNIFTYLKEGRQPFWKTRISLVLYAEISLVLSHYGDADETQGSDYYNLNKKCFVNALISLLLFFVNTAKVNQNGHFI